MNEDEIRTALLQTLAEIAPEADVTTLDDEESLRDQLDIDSMDFLNIALGIYARLGIDVPERDYPRLATIKSAIAYLREAPTRG